MIAVDTSSWIAYLSGAQGDDVPVVDAALADSQVCLPPVVLTELLSDPGLPPRVAEVLSEVPVLDLTPGYWERAGRLRARILAGRRKARLAEALIAQSCLDHGVALVTRNRDFRPFAQVARLKLVP